MSTEPKEQHANEEATRSPDRDDVHEQRQQNQPAPGIVDQPPTPTPKR